MPLPLRAMRCFNWSPEPVAANVLWAKTMIEKNGGDDMDQKHHILVFDFGGGTLDVSLITAFPNSTNKVLWAVNV